MRRFACFLMLLLIVLCPTKLLAEELTLQGRIVDAETGEPLPYVNILVDGATCTLSNIEGEFKLQADEEAKLTFSFVGYNKLSVQANHVSEVVKLKPYTTLMQEVTVLPLEKDDILERIIDHLKQDYREAKHWTRKYFFRAMIEENTVSFVAEAFLNANSALNIRSAEIISGLQGYDKTSGKEQMHLNSSNIHRLIEVAPKTYKSSLWKPVVKPLHALSTTKDFYHVHFKSIQGDEGKLLYRIEFVWSQDLQPMDYNRANITGTAYVDAETCRLLRFDGSANNCKARMGIIPISTVINFHLEYDYSQGFASVSNLAIEGANAFMYYRALLFALENDEQGEGKTKASSSNIVTALEEAGYDETLWSKYDIIRRTKEEEHAAFGK